MSICGKCGGFRVCADPPPPSYRCRCDEAWHQAQQQELADICSRLQALEQNTVPAGSAKQEPRDWHLLRMLPDGPVLQVFWDQPVAQMAKELFEGAAARRYEIIRVREVLDD